MYNIDDKRVHTVASLQQLMNNPNTRPFQFRTRYERTMIKLQSLAKAMGNEDLERDAISSLDKMRHIVDKSNSTSDGVLRSFSILAPEIKKFIEILS